MQALDFHSSFFSLFSISGARIWRITGAVMLAHAGMAWLITSGNMKNLPPATPPARVIMASVVMESPSQPIPQPKTYLIQPKNPPTIQQQSSQQVATKVSAKIQSTPMVTQIALSELAPSASVAPPAAPSVPDATSSATAVSRDHTENPAPNPKPRATGVVVPPSTNADYLNNAPPSYPRVSKRLGEQGTVLIHVLISTEGRAEKAEILTSSGHARLDETALTTVKTWRFVPGTLNGVPEAMWFNVPVRFVLD